MRLIFMGTGQFALPALRRLVDAGYEIIAVYTQPARPAGRGRKPVPSPVKVTALERGLPVLQPEKVSSPEDAAVLAALKPDVIVAAAYGQILRRNVLDIPPKGIVNIHPSLLPRHRGASPVASAILAGDAETGVTIMLMEAALDAGPIIAQRSHPIRPEDTTGTLTAALAEAGADLLMEYLPRYLSGDLQPTPQDPSLVTLAPLVKKEDGLIDWTLPAADIWRRVRAYNPWPSAYTHFDETFLRILEVWPLEVDSDDPPGTVVAAPTDVDARLRGAFAVQTGNGLLVALMVQKEGRRVLPASEFLRGERGFVGRRLT